ncbi:alpha/beta hydrolase fold domain-containing protein [Jannaschia aquimarina]|uniref:MlhB_2 protein n=1 Tax=Jannaschia aquimarina TaxID=935700 RepID=A0A0D1EBZ9_9RHOB|nr:alpha/beta hydrolase [Jannaschia aquimarina]KIT15249.1 Monoterpene epsilon-lactone hydrolase [Jannaschia aquimarina]SNT32287.1 Acetyl esterase/lipase [Jannaschia aquimarina]
MDAGGWTGGPFSGAVGRDDIIRRINSIDLGETPEEMRAGFRKLVLGDTPDAVGPGAPVDVMEQEDGLLVRGSGTAAPEIVWFHGGGYVFGAPETHLRPAAHLALASGRSVFLPRYPLAPENEWPAQLDAALNAIANRPQIPILAGDSAGGHLALVTGLAFARRGTPPPALLLFSPNTDRTGRNEARAIMSNLDPMVDDEDDARLARMCFGDDFDPVDPEVSPLMDDLSLLPPTWIEVGMPEVLRDDAVLLHERAKACGARNVGIEITPGLLHMGQLWAPWWDEARASLDRAAAFLDRM